MGCPTGVAQPNGALEQLLLAGHRQSPDFALGLAELQLAGGVDDGDAGTVVPAVLQPLQPFEDYGPGFPIADVSNYSAHGSLGETQDCAPQYI